MRLPELLKNQQNTNKKLYFDRTLRKKNKI